MLWNYKLLFGQTTMGRIHACCRKTDYVENTCFLSLVLTRIFRILLRFYSDFTQISAQKIGYWELYSQVLPPGLLVVHDAPRGGQHHLA